MRFWKQRGGNTSGHRLPLIIHIGIVLVIALGAAWMLWRLWSGTWALTLTESLDDKARFEVAKIVLAIVGGLGGVVFLTIGYRKQRDGEAAERRNDAAERRNDAAEAREQAKHFHERFGAAAEQLGSATPRVRLAGVYAMAALADDWDAGRQTCINVLCGYIRAPYEPPRDLNKKSTDEALKEHRAATEEREVRRAILDTIGERFRVKPRDGETWHGHRFDLKEAALDTGDLSNITVTPGTIIDLTRAQFPGGTVDFRGAVLSGGTVDFTHAVFSGGTVAFTHAVFSGGTVNFTGAVFSGGAVGFRGAVLSGGTVDFTRAVFSGGTVDFRDAVFSGGTVNFTRAEFSGGAVYFRAAKFSGGTVNFTGAVLSGGTVDFTRAVFSGSAVDFRAAKFSGGMVDLGQPGEWSKPPVFDDFPDGPPEGLILPP